MPASDYQCWLGKEIEDLKWVGKRGIIRRDADDKATGKAIYGRDVKLHGMLYARVMMCPYAHAKIKSMDTSEAEKLPGVRAVLRYDDPMVPQRIWNPWDMELMFKIYMTSCHVPWSILGPETWFEGSPTGVAIVADELDIADEALDLVKVEWEVKDFVIEYQKALEPGAPLVYDHLTSYDPNLLVPYRQPFGGNYGTENFSIEPGWEGAENANNVKLVTEFSLPETDMEAGFAEAEQTIEFTFHRTEIIGYGPEILCTVAQWVDNGNLEIWQGGEAPVNIMLNSMWSGIPMEKFVINSPYAGAQFGGWDGLPCTPQSSQIPIAAYLSKKTGRPVKVVFQRKDERWSEMDEGTFNIKVGFKNDGTITAIDMDNITAQCGDCGFIPETVGGGHFYESTKIANLHGICTTAHVNKNAFGPSRCEQQIDAHVKQQVFTRVAAALGVDEGTIAEVNNGQEGHDMVWVSEWKQANKIPDIDSLSVVLETGKGAIDWNGKFHAPGAKMLPNGKLHGMCLSPNHEFSNGGQPSPEVHFRHFYFSIKDGKLYMVAHRPDCGVDGRTGYSRTIAEETGMNFEDIKYDRQFEGGWSMPKTELSGGGGSVVFTLTSWSIVAMSRAMKQKMLAVASATLGIDVADLDIVDSKIVQKSDPSNSYAIEEIPSLDGVTTLWEDVNWETLDMPGIIPTPMMISRCLNIVEVEVDPETGGVELTNAVAVNDLGVPVGPETCEGQMYGAAIMGYSTGAIEEVVYDDLTGIRLNPNFLDYKIFTILDAPPVDCHMVTSRMGYGPYGSCGVGEDNCTFGSPMIIPAIYNAIGKWVDTYPPTPERVLKALGKA